MKNSESEISVWGASKKVFLHAKRTERASGPGEVKKTIITLSIIEDPKGTALKIAKETKLPPEHTTRTDLQFIKSHVNEFFRTIEKG